VKLVVVSPHCDDAVFGAGQLIAAHPGAVVVTVFAASAAQPAGVTRWDAASGFGPGDDAMAARRAEDRDALASLGAAPRWLPFHDSQYGRTPRPDAIATALEAAILASRAEVVCAPLGLFHSDHALTHDAALAIRARHRELRWLLYADAIYRRIPDVVRGRFAQLAARGIRPVAVAPPADDTLARKRAAVHAYRSQLRALAAPGHPGWEDTLAPDAYWSLEP
jgi:LmbE family N-acetylglucosaminyl deacetylase